MVIKFYQYFLFASARLLKSGWPSHTLVFSGAGLDFFNGKGFKILITDSVKYQIDTLLQRIFFRIKTNIYMVLSRIELSVHHLYMY